MASTNVYGNDSPEKLDLGGKRAPVRMSVDASNVDQANALFQEIAGSSHEIDRLCFHLDSDSDDADMLYLHIDTMRKLVARIGWLADLGCKKLTGNEWVKGAAEQWMMNPMYVEMLRATAKEVVHG